MSVEIEVEVSSYQHGRIAIFDNILLKSLESLIIYLYTINKIGDLSDSRNHCRIHLFHEDFRFSDL